MIENVSCWKDRFSQGILGENSVGRRMIRRVAQAR